MPPLENIVKRSNITWRRSPSCEESWNIKISESICACSVISSHNAIRGFIFTNFALVLACSHVVFAWECFWFLLTCAVPTNLREHPVFSAQVFTFTRQEKPGVKIETWAEKTGFSRRLPSHLHLNFHLGQAFVLFYIRSRLRFLFTSSLIGFELIGGVGALPPRTVPHP